MKGGDTVNSGLWVAAAIKGSDKYYMRDGDTVGNRPIRLRQFKSGFWRWFGQWETTIFEGFGWQLLFGLDKFVWWWEMRTAAKMATLGFW